MNDTITETVRKFISAHNNVYFDDCDLLYSCLDVIDCKQVKAIDFANIFLDTYIKYVADILPLEQFYFNTTDKIMDLFHDYVLSY
jgi:hypothetical protein